MKEYGGGKSFVLLVELQVGAAWASAHYFETNKDGVPILKVRICTDFVSFDLLLLQPSRSSLQIS